MVDFTKMSKTDTINVHFVPKEPRINSDILQLPERIKEECDLKNLNKAEIMRLLTIGTLTDEDGDLITLEAINGSIPQGASKPSEDPDQPGKEDPENPGEEPENPGEGEDPEQPGGGEDPENPGEGGEDPENPGEGGEEPENPGEGGNDQPSNPNPPSGGGGGLIWEDLGDLLG